MKVALVNPPQTGIDRDEVAPPLGLLRLATIAEQQGAEVSIQDFNLLHYLDPRLRRDFYGAAMDRLKSLDADIYGFTSMAVDSHVAIELARRLKEHRPEVLTVFGGPHFSSISSSLKQHIPWVDVVIRGEGEEQFARFLRERRSSPTLGVVSGTHAGTGALPSPAYSLVQMPAYFAVNPRHRFNFEAGRGCKFKCSFCYSPGYYTSVRDFGVSELIEELDDLRKLGAHEIFIVGDNFVNQPEWAVRFCKALEEATLGLTWTCYVTFPQMSPAIVQAMSRAGCTDVFMGLDAIGDSSQRAFHKAFVRESTPMEGRLEGMAQAGITPTCGFIIAPPSHPAGVDLEATVCTALKARCSGANILFNVLNLYPGTPAHNTFGPSFEADSLQTKLLLDVPEVVEINMLAEAHPEWFPFHSRYVARDEWGETIRLAHCLHTLVNSFPQTLTGLWTAKNVSPITVARRVGKRVGDLSRQPNRELRRMIELQSSCDELRPLSSGTSVLRDFDKEISLMAMDATLSV